MQNRKNSVHAIWVLGANFFSLSVFVSECELYSSLKPGTVYKLLGLFYAVTVLESAGNHCIFCNFKKNLLIFTFAKLAKVLKNSVIYINIGHECLIFPAQIFLCIALKLNDWYYLIYYLLHPLVLPCAW